MNTNRRFFLPAALVSLVLTGGMTGPGNASAARTISVNFTGARGGNYPVSTGNYAGQNIGYGNYAKPGSAWMDVTFSGSDGAATGGEPTVPFNGLTFKDDTGDTVPYSGVKLYFCSRGGDYTWYDNTVSDGNTQMLHIYLDDSGSTSSEHAGFKLGNLPFSRYTVLVYFNRDGAGAIPAYSVNGVYYTGTAEGAAAAASTDAWGAPHGMTKLEPGKNTLIVKNLTNSTLTVKAPGATPNSRGCISGFQVVGELPDTLTWAGGDGSWSDAAKWRPMRWVNGLAAIFPEGGPGTVTVDTAVSAAGLAFDGSYTLTAGDGGSIRLSGPVTVADGKAASILAPLSGQLKKSGAGLLAFDPEPAACSSYTFAGPVSLNNGTLEADFALAGDAVFTNGVFRRASAADWAVPEGDAPAITLAAGATLDIGASRPGQAAALAAGSAGTLEAVIPNPLAPDALIRTAATEIPAGQAFTFRNNFGETIPSSQYTVTVEDGFLTYKPADGHLEPPFTVTLTGNADWTEAGWTDAGGAPVPAAAWAGAGDATVTVSADNAVLTVDTNVAAASIRFLGGKPLTLKFPKGRRIAADVSIDAGQAVALDLSDWTLTEDQIAAGETVEMPVIAGAADGVAVGTFPAMPGSWGVRAAPAAGGGIALVYEYEPVVFTDPADWQAAAPFPTTAKRDAPAAEPSYAFDDAFTQDVAGREATVVSVTNAPSKINLWGVHKCKYETGGRAFDRDIFLDVRGGAFANVSAGLAAWWAENANTPPNASVKGRQLTQLSGTARADYVFGAGEMGGRHPALTGDAGVVIRDGAVVLGSVVGGWTSQHNAMPKVTGNTAVLIQNVQSETTAGALNSLPADLIVGGSAWGSNTSSGSRIGGSTSVTIDIPAVEGPANFVKTIIGGSRSADAGQGGDQTVDGNASVTITAPLDVTFTAPIYAGGVNPGGGSVQVKGKATLTLNGGTFACALNGGIADGDKTIVFNGTNVLGAGAAVSGFDKAEFRAGSVTRIAGAITLDGIGAAVSGAGAALEVPAGGSLSYDIAIGTSLPAFTQLDGAVTVLGCAMDNAQILEGYKAPAAKVAPETAPAAVTSAFSGTILLPGGGTTPAVFTLGSDGTTVLMGAESVSGSIVHTPAAGETDFTWDKTHSFDEDALFRDFYDVTFHDAAGGDRVAVSVPDPVLAGNVSIGAGLDFTGRLISAASLTKTGDGGSSVENDVFAGDVAVAAGALEAGGIAAGTVAVSNGAALRAGLVGKRPVRFLRLTITKGNGGEAPAIAELRLFRRMPGGGFEKVEWPAGTKLNDSWNTKTTYRGGSGTANLKFEDDARNSNWKNESLPALIDGVYEGCGISGTVSGEGIWPSNNKWWPRPVPAWVVIEFPKAIPLPAGYNFCFADQSYRNPQSWTVEASPDGSEWREVSRVSKKYDSAKAWCNDNGGGADKPAFLFPEPGEDDLARVAVAEGGTLDADGDYTAALELKGGATLKALPGRCLTLRGASSAQFGADPKVKVDLSGYDAASAGNHYILTGDAAEWPEAGAFEVTPGLFGFGLGKDNNGYFATVSARALAWSPGRDGGAILPGTWLAGGAETPWTAGEPAARTFFRNGDSVTFGGLGGGLAVVNLSGTVRPAKADFTAADDGTAYLLQKAEGADANLEIAGRLSVSGLVTNRAPCLISGPVQLDGTLVLDTDAGTEQTVSGKISGAGDVVKEGAGTASLTAKNDATGGITVKAGLLILDSGNNVVGKQAFTRVTVAEGATLRIGRDDIENENCAFTNAGTVETANFNAFRSMTLDGGTVKSTGSINAWWLTSACYDGTLKVTGGKTSRLTAASEDATLYHQVENLTIDADAGSELVVNVVLMDHHNNLNGRSEAYYSWGVTKTGAGRTAVNRAPIYKGRTVINAGTYEMNAAQTAGGAYTVAAAGTLGGTGSVQSDIALDGTIAATLACSNITMNAGAVIDARPAGSKLAVSGTPTVAEGGTVRINVAGRKLAAGEKLVSWGEGKMPDGRFTLSGGIGFGVEKRPEGVFVIPAGTVLILR